METDVKNDKQDQKIAESSVLEYREELRRLIESEVKSLMDEEIQKAGQELIEEQRKAIAQLVEEHRAALQAVVEEEKRAIWTRLEELRRSILKLGL